VSANAIFIMGYLKRKKITSKCPIRGKAALLKKKICQTGRLLKGSQSLPSGK